MLNNQKSPLIPMFCDCPFCGKTSIVFATEQEVACFLETGDIGETFAHRSAEERELLISGVCASCWDTLSCDDECCEHGVPYDEECDACEEQAAMDYWENN